MSVTNENYKDLVKLEISRPTNRDKKYKCMLIFPSLLFAFEKVN